MFSTLFSFLESTCRVCGIFILSYIMCDRGMYLLKCRMEKKRQKEKELEEKLRKMRTSIEFARPTENTIQNNTKTYAYLQNQMQNLNFSERQKYQMEQMMNQVNIPKYYYPTQLYADNIMYYDSSLKDDS